MHPTIFPKLPAMRLVEQAPVNLPDGRRILAFWIIDPTGKRIGKVSGDLVAEGRISIERRARVAVASTPSELMAAQVRACSIRCKDHPEWGTFGVMEDHGMWFDIHGAPGGRSLSKQEADQCWEIVPSSSDHDLSDPSGFWPRGDAPPPTGPHDVTHETLPDETRHNFTFPIRCF